jgi:hypothetical protein
MRPISLKSLSLRISTRLTRRAGMGLLTTAGLPLLGRIDSTGAKKKKKVTLCVNGQTVKKSKKKARKLAKKGATRGNCEPLRCGNGGPCTVFVTSIEFTGAELAGLSGGDAKCQAVADGAGLPGTFKAWLSAGSQSPKTRFTNIAKAGPYHLVANASDSGNPPPLVATDFADLTTCPSGTCLQHAIDRNQRGEPFLSSVWTGTLADGDAAERTCQGWTSVGDFEFGVIGGTDKIDADWTGSNAFSALCAAPEPIYCFQQAT